MWFSISLAVVLVVMCVFLAFLALEPNSERVHQLLIGGAVIAGTMAIFILVAVVMILLMDFSSAGTVVY